MSYYRLYFLHNFSGHIQRFEDFEVASDDEALVKATLCRGLFPLELWCEQRRIARINAVEPTLAASP
jgi:hypothetical protein